MRWDKGFNRVTETEQISYECGDDFALLFASMKMSNSGTYRPTVTVSKDTEENNAEPICMICVGVHGWQIGCNMILLKCTQCNIHD